MHISHNMIGSRAVDGKRFLESNVSSNPGTYCRLGKVKVPKIEKAFAIRGTFYRQLPLIQKCCKQFTFNKHFKASFFRQGINCCDLNKLGIYLKLIEKLTDLNQCTIYFFDSDLVWRIRLMIIKG